MKELILFLGAHPFSWILLSLLYLPLGIVFYKYAKKLRHETHSDIVKWIFISLAEGLLLWVAMAYMMYSTPVNQEGYVFCGLCFLIFMVVWWGIAFYLYWLLYLEKKAGDKNGYFLLDDLTIFPKIPKGRKVIGIVYDHENSKAFYPRIEKFSYHRFDLWLLQLKKETKVSGWRKPQSSDLWRIDFLWPRFKDSLYDANVQVADVSPLRENCWNADKSDSFAYACKANEKGGGLISRCNTKENFNCIAIIDYSQKAPE